MIYDIQKASILKRISAFMLDAIVLVILVTGMAALLSGVLNYDSYNQRLLDSYEKYEQEYNVSFDISQEDFDKMTKEEQQKFNDAFAALSKDQEAVYVYNMLVNLALVICSFSVLLSFAVTELIIPLVFGNGQTIGKRIFGIALMRTGGFKINTVCLFIRTILGKYTIETMIPLLIIILLIFGSIGVTGTMIIGAIFLVQLILMSVTRNNSAIHDFLADTVVVDYTSQMIFNSPEDRVEYLKKYAAENASRSDY